MEVLVNYIKRLELENQALRQEKQEAANMIKDLQRYLVSPKFHQDTTVQVQDVMNRIQWIPMILS